MAALKQTESDTQTPEQLLLLLDAQLAAQRAKRSVPNRQRSAYLALAVVFIIGVGAVALMIAQQMMIGHQERGAMSEPVSKVELP